MISCVAADRHPVFTGQIGRAGHQAQPHTEADAAAAIHLLLPAEAQGRSLILGSCTSTPRSLEVCFSLQLW